MAPHSADCIVHDSTFAIEETLRDLDHEDAPQILLLLNSASQETLVMSLQRGGGEATTAIICTYTYIFGRLLSKKGLLRYIMYYSGSFTVFLIIE